MKREHIKFYGFLLTIILLFSGMCPESLRADSLLAYIKTIANKDRVSQCGGLIEPCYSKISELPVCTAKMLDAKRSTGQIFCQEKTGIRKAARLFFSCFSVVALSCFFCFLIVVRCKQFPESKQIAIILDYIHHMDGKKKLS